MSKATGINLAVFCLGYYISLLVNKGFDLLFLIYVFLMILMIIFLKTIKDDKTKTPLP